MKDQIFSFDLRVL